VEVVRTPDERFAHLPGYPFRPHHVEVETDGLAPVRMHYLDEGPADGPVVLMLHGQPTWSYLYRTVVPVLVADGLRVVAPDNIGFGRSDKPTRATDYTFARHIGWIGSLVRTLDLHEVTLVVQFDRPFVTAYSDGDPATRGWESVFQERVPGARGRRHVTIAGAGHFVQEDAGPELAHIVAEVVRTT
jgi:pimeloyl-ACP methyl ester carboxylesterase